jgi:xylan alpha-glucuronosyltransferase
MSSINVQWEDVHRALGDLNGEHKKLRIGLVNFNSTEYGSWRQIFSKGQVSNVRLEPVKDAITWQTLYPEWIDEEEEYDIPSCPSLPEPNVRRGVRFDVIAVKLPCTRVAGWSRDVARLHLQLSAAKLAVASSSSTQDHKVHVLFVTECFPLPNLFPCKSLVRHEGNAWLYSPHMKALREKLRLPVGSCELAVPLKATCKLFTFPLFMECVCVVSLFFNSEHDQIEEPRVPNSWRSYVAAARLFSVDRGREAYATILHSASEYVCGAIVAAQSIRQAGSTRDLVILVDDTISDHHRKGLVTAGWKVRIIQRIRNPKATRDAYNEWNYSKFRLWQLTDYDKVIFIDADLLILRNVDFLFAMPEITATGNDATLFNSGVMVIEPSNCTFRLLMEHINEITSYNGGDQGYLNEIFTWWHRVPKHMNFLKHFWDGDSDKMKAAKELLFGADPPVIYVLHYLGLKPWLCSRDYDCNWNNRRMHHFASDVAHARWWKVHDSMPEDLQSHCLLKSRQKAALEWDRRQAEKANLSDGHWRRNITDTRLKVCIDKYCFWESMLLHWGENKPGTATSS